MTNINNLFSFKRTKMHKYIKIIWNSKVIVVVLTN